MNDYFNENQFFSLVTFLTLPRPKSLIRNFLHLWQKRLFQDIFVQVVTNTDSVFLGGVIGDSAGNVSCVSYKVK